MSLTKEFLTLAGHESGDLPRRDPAAAPFPVCGHPPPPPPPTASKATCGRQLLPPTRLSEMKGLTHLRGGPAKISASLTPQALVPLVLGQEQRDNGRMTTGAPAGHCGGSDRPCHH